MKKEFNVLKGRQKVSIEMTRDSVTAGDDVDAPHEKSLNINTFTNPVVLAREASANYLPKIAQKGSGLES